ncbi:unnamed protein product, partial [marine sediment metagenome]
MKQKSDLLKKEDKGDLNRAREYALKFLEYRERSEQEIRKRMAKKEYDGRLIKETIEFLKNHNLLNDRRFARMWTESRLRRNYGRWKVQADLNEKGIDREIIEEVLRESYSNVDEIQIALDLIQKKWPFLKEGNDAPLRRVSDFLKRRGFSFEVIAEAIRQQY